MCSVAYSSLSISVSSIVTTFTTHWRRLQGAEVATKDGSMIVILPIPIPGLVSLSLEPSSSGKSMSCCGALSL